MKTVLLVNQDYIPHYRVPVYNYLSRYLYQRNFQISFLATEIQERDSFSVTFDFVKINPSFRNLLSFIKKRKPSIIIFWMNPKLYIFPLILIAKTKGIKIIHWGHRRDQQRPWALHKNLIYDMEHMLDDAIIIYADHMKKMLPRLLWRKTFVANNTLNLLEYDNRGFNKDLVKQKYGILTKINIVCLGRMQKRKRIEDLVRAFRMIKCPKIGLVLAGPDDDNLLGAINEEQIYKVGPIYGKESLDLLRASDVYCLPGAIGLGIVDAFFCGLPVVTERVRHGPEIMYLKNEINGYIVPKGDLAQLARKLENLVHNDELREKFSLAAKKEVMSSGHIDRLCEGFYNALLYVSNT